MPVRPPPPPWGSLITDALRRNGLSVREAARRAGISDVRWGQIASGWERRGGRYLPVPARRVSAVHTLATMAMVAGVTSGQMRAVGRGDVAEVLSSDALADVAGEVMLRKIEGMDADLARRLLARIAVQLGVPAEPAAERRYGT